MSSALAALAARDRTDDWSRLVDPARDYLHRALQAGSRLGVGSALPPEAGGLRGSRRVSVYVARRERGRGAGRAAMEALVREAESRGFWKLVSRIFPENEASLALCRALGFREVGIYRRHAKLDGEWRDVVIVELLLGDAASAR